MAVHMHSHDHGHPSAERRLPIALALTLGFAAVELAAGWYANSLALMGDAGHMVTDASALGLATLGAMLARRPASLRHSFGMGRAEIIAALTNALFMLAVVASISFSAIVRLQSPPPIHGPTVVLVAVVGLVVNAVVLLVLGGGEQNLNVRGAILHVIGDLLGSVAALVAGIVAWTSGWWTIDPLLSLLICALILVAGTRLLWETLHVLMEGVPRHLDLQEIGYAMAQVDGVQSVHDLHIWAVSSHSVALSAHLVIDDMDDWQTVLSRQRRLLADRFGIEHATLQPEPCTLPLKEMPIDSRIRE